MKNHNEKNTAIVDEATLFDAFSELVGAVVLLTRANIMMFLRNVFSSEISRVSKCDKNFMPQQCQWPRWVWLALSLGLAVITAPTFLFLSVLMIINSHCDYPFFWWSLPAIILISDAVALLRTIRLQNRHQFNTASGLANYYVDAAMQIGCALFLLAGWSSGLLPDLIALFSGSRSIVLSLLGSIALSVIFSVFSFSHVGAVHVWFSAHKLR